MDCTASFLSYGQTGFFSKIALDYISRAAPLKPFYKHPVSPDGIKAAIADRKQFATNRPLLVTVLQKQYAAADTSKPVAANIELLSRENTFTITTAHQPNIFTGPLYFIYKILHVVKLAEELKAQLPENNFVPVYYMGSEDADLDELGHIFVDGQKYQWDTKQTGAVGRMKVDKALVKLLDDVNGQLAVHPCGAEIIALMKDCYKEGVTIEQATFKLVNHLFADYGLIILLPDNAELKGSFTPVIQKELLEEFSQVAVQETISQYPEGYKAQASGRELNMFYLEGNKRERIEMQKDVTGNVGWSVVNTDLKFTKDEIITVLNEHPERFSPNVILRPVFQEWVLPNIAFIGGGGEIAYWLQLKKVFETLQVPYPLMVVRNSFMFVSKEMQVLANKLKFDQADLFQPELTLINQLVKRDSRQRLSLAVEMEQMTSLYQQLKSLAGGIDATLGNHTEALQKQALKKLAALEKKMLRAEKQKFEAEQRQLKKLKSTLFPNNNLQERIDNLMPYYATFGKGFIQMLYNHSKGLEQVFGILKEAE